MTLHTDQGADMARKVRPPTAVDDEVDLSNAPQALVKSAFIRRVTKALDAKGWNQSDLARAAARHTSDKEFRRDNISVYLNADKKTLPRRPHLVAIAKALDMEPDELLPTRGDRSANEMSPINLRDIGGGKVWLTINQEMALTTALKILELIHGDRRASD